VIVVDNASTQPLPALPSEVKVIRTERRLSTGTARNAGLAHVGTPYVAFVDADDALLPGALSFCLSELDAHPEDVACGGSLLAWDAATGHTRPCGRPRDHVLRLSRRRLPLALYLLGRCAFFLETGAVLRTDALVDAGGFGDGDYAEDWQLAAALAFRGPIALHRRPVGLYRIHDQSLYASARGRALYAASMRALRVRMRRDPRVPRWVKLLVLPLLVPAHELKARLLERAEARGDPRSFEARPGGVTAVVAVWDDYCSLLPDCVHSLLDQQPPPRVIVVDNASRQALPPLPAEVEIVRLPGRVSVGAARNAGLERVATPFVLFCDADDRMLPGAVAFLRSRLERRPELVSAVGRFSSWNAATGEELLADRMPRPVVFRVSRRPRLFALANLRYNCFLLVGCLHRTDAVRDAGGFADADLGEDWVLGTQLAFRGPLEFVHRVVFRHRIAEGSLWHRPHTRRALSDRCKRLRERVGADPRVPRWVKAALPLLALIHDHDVRRLTRHGDARPRDDFAAAAQREAAA
jgi:glycosyltransferase involved in cell wall biosynthesis